MKKNPAVAARDRQIIKSVKREYRNEDGTVDVECEQVLSWERAPPALTEGHFDNSDVIAATRRAQLAERYRGGETKLDVVRLGQGNFGEAFMVGTRDPVVVKLPARENLHGRPWSHKEQVENLMHEVGVANELRELGADIAPKSIYVELKDGTPAIVREYGSPVTSMTPEEFFEVEKSLMKVESLGWSVQDELDLFRRDDGTMFVSDVGIWQAPTDSKRSKRRSSESHLSGLLQSLAARVFGVSYWRMPVLPSMSYYASELDDALTKDRGDFFVDVLREDLVESIEKRDKFGLPVPKWIRQVAEDARQPEVARPNGHRGISLSDQTLLRELREHGLHAEAEALSRAMRML